MTIKGKLAAECARFRRRLNFLKEAYDRVDVALNESPNTVKTKTHIWKIAQTEYWNQVEKYIRLHLEEMMRIYIEEDEKDD